MKANCLEIGTLKPYCLFFMDCGFSTSKNYNAKPEKNKICVNCHNYVKKNQKNNNLYGSYKYKIVEGKGKVVKVK